jgi:S-adenosylhomocysteine hydrolase
MTPLPEKIVKHYNSYAVHDIKLAELGGKEIEIAAHEMPSLMSTS